MNYTIRYDPAAETDLAEIWTTAPDRRAVTEAADWLDERLSRTPFQLGESRISSVHRVAFHRPLGIEYEVVEDDKLILIHGVFSVG